MSRDSGSLLDIADAARTIVAFTQGMELATFSDDIAAQAVVLHRLIVLGEAVKRLTPAFRAAHPDVPWRQAAGTRDMLVHGYDQVNLVRIWVIAIEHIPRLLAQIEPLLPVEPTEES